MFLKNKNIIFKIRRSKVTDYAALRISVINKFETLLIISLQVLTCLLLIIFANSLDQVKGQIKVGLDLDPICFIL